MNTNQRNQDFPFDEIRQESGDYFEYIQQAKDAGYNENQIWSVTEEDNVFCYGPSRHWINILGYIATDEQHDNNTYYFESIEDYGPPL